MGILIVVVILSPLKENLYVLYIGSFLLTSVIELVTEYELEINHDSIYNRLRCNGLDHNEIEPQNESIPSKKSKINNDILLKLKEKL